MASIDLDNVNLTFRVREQHQITLKEYLLKMMFLKQRNPQTEIRALQNFTLKIREGERVGVIGANGSGKSTLLRLLAGVYHPTSGRSKVRGKVCSLFELTLGFEMEYNGWKNIYSRGYLQGESTATMKSKAKEIAEFSELGRFLDIPIRFYSSGMLVRLAFSIATAMEPEVLLVDEVLSAGDLAFQNKARRRMREMIAQARLLVAVSHDLESLPDMCNRAIWLDRGRVLADGPVDDVIEAYRDHVQENSEFSPSSRQTEEDWRKITLTPNR